MFDRVAATALVVLALAALVLAGRAHAALDVWDNTPGGNWSNAANWTDGTVPGINDSATFNLAQVYPVTFNSDPGVIQALTLSAGSVTFQSSGGPRTLSLTAGAGSQDVVVTGATTTLTLGAMNNPVSLVAGDDLSIQNGGTLAALFGSDVTANDLSGSGLNGTLRIDGAGSTLTLGGNVANVIGASGIGAVFLQNDSTGNSINSDLGLASSASAAANGSLSILGGAKLALGGNLTLANQNVAGQIASLSIQRTNSSLTQSGARTVTVGSAANGTATIAIGTTNNGGSFASGTGLFTVNKTGAVTIGGGTNSGTLSIGGDLKIDGGLLNKATTLSTLDLAADAIVTILNGGRLMAAGSWAAESNQVFDVSGANSRIETTANGAFAIDTGAQVNVSAAATVVAAGGLHVARVAGPGALAVAGEGSTLTAGNELSLWGSDGGTANVSLSNKAVATLNSGIDMANSATAGTSATASVLSGAVLNAGDLRLAAEGGQTTAATLHINGADSSVTQSGAAALTVGHDSEGAAAINIGVANDGGALTTGSGLLRINKTGRIKIGDGANAGGLNVLGNILVDGGVLEQGSAESTFAWTTGKSLTVENGGLVHFASTYVSAPSATHTVTGVGSRFEIDGAFHLRSAAQVGVLAGATIEAEEFNVGGGGATGALTIDGAGSTAIGGGGDNQWGSGGNASVALGNNASMTLAGSLTLAETAATIAQVLSGAELAVGDLSIATAGASVNGTLNVVGLGSSLTLHPARGLAIGHATSGVGALNIDDGGSVAVGAGGATTIHNTGTVNIAAGSANLGALSVVGGTVNVNGGTLTFSSLSINGGLVKLNSGRVEQTGNLSANAALLTALAGPTHELTLGKTLAAAGGTANVSANLDLNGGRLEGNAINVVNSGANATVLRLRNGGAAQSGGAATLASGTTVFVENAGSFVAAGQLTQASELRLAGTGRVAAASLANTGLVTGSGRVDANFNNQAAGQVRLADDERIVIRGTNHQNNGLVDVDHGELEVATGTFTNGTANPSTATIAARDASLRFTGGLVNAGSIVCSEGTCDFFGDVTNVNNQPTIGRIVITANSQATFYDDVVNRGAIQVSAAGLVKSTALFLGSLTGSGVAGSGSVFLEGDVLPGSAIGTMAFGGDVSIGAASTVRMEIAGTTAGQFDRITVAQSLVLSGTLQLSLSSGFVPSLGQSFDLFDWGTRSGTFSTLIFPALNGLTWNTSQLYTTGVVSIAAATLAGDFNGDGAVDAADYTVWRDGLGSIYTQADYGIWKSHFGQSIGSVALAAHATVAPEPSACGLALTTLAATGFVRTRRRRWRVGIRWSIWFGGAIAATVPAHAAITSLGEVAPPPATSTAASTLVVGNTGTGTVVVNAGSDVLALNSYLGQSAGALGVVRIEGAGSTWTAGQSMLIGNAGSGIVQVLDGGQIQSASSAIGAQAGSTGTVSIEGGGSKWMVNSHLFVGDAGSGTLSIAGGGLVDVANDLIIGNSASGDGMVQLAEGTLRLHGNQLRVNGGTGILDFSGGRIEGAGVVDLDGPLAQYGGTLAPGNSIGTTRIDGGYILDVGELEIEINGTGMPGIQSDRLQVNGTVDLLGDNGIANGRLQVVLGFAPAISDEFLILENDSSDAIVGTFAAGAAASAAFGNRRYVFEILYNAGDGNDVVLRTNAIHALGDFNGDGTVDAADYTVWRDGLGTLYTLAEYSEWKSQFGQSVGAGAVVDSADAVPEPVTLWSATAVAMAFWCRFPRTPPRGSCLK